MADRKVQEMSKPRNFWIEELQTSYRLVSDNFAGHGKGSYFKVREVTPAETMMKTEAERLIGYLRIVEDAEHLQFGSTKKSSWSQACTDWLNNYGEPEGTSDE